MANPAEPPPGLRPLGNSRTYSAVSVPERLRRWHAPRVNRWERLHVAEGRITIERLAAAGVVADALAANDARWIAPGRRWRIAAASAGARFEVGVHAEDVSIAAQAPRAEALDEAPRTEVADARAFIALIGELSPGERRILRGSFEPAAALAELLRANAGRIFWHPLSAGADGFVALIARSTEPFGLADYLGRDHAVIEAALAGALRGEGESRRWLRATLARHLAIEEELLFPAYVAAGGREAWVRGLENEHAHLRRFLAGLDQADSRRKFLRLLDGHDEKEERVVYPDIVSRLGESSAAILDSALRFVLPPDAIAVSDVQPPLPR